MTANGTFAKTFVLFLLVLAGGAVGWSQVTVGAADQVEIPGWTWIFLLGAFAVAMVCIFKPKASPFLAPLYAVIEGVFLGALSKAFEVRWDGIVFQAVLATIGVFFATLALYVFGIVKVTKRFTDGGHRRDVRASSSCTSSARCCRCSASTSCSGTSPARSASSSAS